MRGGEGTAVERETGHRGDGGEGSTGGQCMMDQKVPEVTPGKGRVCRQEAWRVYAGERKIA